jgi:excisionase family DNA binding protein
MCAQTTSPRTRDERLSAIRARRPTSRAGQTAPMALPAPPRAPRAVRDAWLQLLERTTPPTEPTEPTKRLLTLEETGKLLRVGRTTVWEMVNAGDLTAVRIRGKLLIPREEPERYLADLVEDARAVAEARRSLRRKPSTLAASRQ